MKEAITVEVVFAQPDKQLMIAVKLPPGASVLQAIEASGILDQFPAIDLTKNKVGIFGKLARLDAVLRDKDRVEIYRSLVADPKEARRKRALKLKI
jgi:uncharacterized protein